MNPQLEAICEQRFNQLFLLIWCGSGATSCLDAISRSDHFLQLRRGDYLEITKTVDLLEDEVQRRVIGDKSAARVPPDESGRRIRLRDRDGNNVEGLSS